jgi:Putative motility protein
VADDPSSDLALSSLNKGPTMNGISSATVNNAGSGDLSSVQGQAALSVLKSAMNQQAASTAQLLASLPQAAPASMPGMGAHVNTVA